MKTRAPLIFLATFALLSGCFSASTPRVSDCADELSRTQILDAAQRFLAVAAPGTRVEDLSLAIRRTGCDYAVVIRHEGVEAVEDVVILVDRHGRVRNIPICCDLNDCPELCLGDADVEN